MLVYVDRTSSLHSAIKQVRLFCSVVVDDGTSTVRSSTVEGVQATRDLEPVIGSLVVKGEGEGEVG